MSIIKLSSNIRAERSSILNSYVKNIKNSNDKRTLRSTIEDLIKRTGIAEYMKTIQSQSQNTTKTAQQLASSLLDISYIKDSVDRAVASKKYDNFVDILNELQKIIVTDKDIPKELSYVQNNIFQDKKLVEYVKNLLPESNEVSYDLTGAQAKDGDPTKENYFNFIKDNKDKPTN